MTKLFLYCVDAERCPLIVVRTVDRTKTVGLFSVTAEDTKQRTFRAHAVRTIGSDPVLRTEKQPITFSAVVNDTVLGRGTASFGVRRVRFEQVGLHVPADWFERARGSNEMVMVPAREGSD